MAAMVCVHTDKIVVPFGGRDAYFGTNPFAFGFPGTRDAILWTWRPARSPGARSCTPGKRASPSPRPGRWTRRGTGAPIRSKPPRCSPSRGQGLRRHHHGRSPDRLMIGGVFGPHLKPMYAELAVLPGSVVVHSGDGSGGVRLRRRVLERTQRMIDELHRHPPAPGVAQVLVPGGDRAAHHGTQPARRHSRPTVSLRLSCEIRTNVRRRCTADTHANG